MKPYQLTDEEIQQELMGVFNFVENYAINLYPYRRAIEKAAHKRMVEYMRDKILGASKKNKSVIDTIAELLKELGVE